MMLSVLVSVFSWLPYGGHGLWGGIWVVVEVVTAVAPYMGSLHSFSLPIHMPPWHKGYLSRTQTWFCHVPAQRPSVTPSCTTIHSKFLIPNWLIQNSIPAFFPSVPTYYHHFTYSSWALNFLAPCLSAHVLTSAYNVFSLMLKSGHDLPRSSSKYTLPSVLSKTLLQSFLPHDFPKHVTCTYYSIYYKLCCIRTTFMNKNHTCLYISPTWLRVPGKKGLDINCFCHSFHTIKYWAW